MNICQNCYFPSASMQKQLPQSVMNSRDLYHYLTDCPDDTICMDFQFNPSPFTAFFAKLMKSTVINSQTTLSIDIYNSTQKLALVRSISISTGSQSGSKQNTNNYSRISWSVEALGRTGAGHRGQPLFSGLDSLFLNEQNKRRSSPGASWSVEALGRTGAGHRGQPLFSGLDSLFLNEQNKRRSSPGAV
ncbi:hypothetical protein Glove_633g12 [Diversispora epigaea]|uniref:Uncharacterized protein n=1 Tax=Diversispora epigaea TaxID=1348612 RepID=A0A397G697_9GLOM|nr:hypothetical protein Glove_633g12 [Diversispora epigaea]